MMRDGFRILSLTLAACATAMPAIAQEPHGARISGFYAGALGEGDTNVGTGGSVGYRFSSRLGLDFEVLALPDFQLDEAGSPGRGVAFLTSFVTEFPSPATWLTPYVQGGGGVANIRLEPDVTAVDRDNRRISFPVRGGRGPFSALGDDMRVVQVGAGRRDTSVALSVGGGVDFAIWRGLSVGPNISYLKLFGNLRDIDLTRVGARASYRF
jgi:opacity protein-like surface antigen